MNLVLKFITQYLKKHPEYMELITKEVSSQEESPSVYFLKNKEGGWWFIGIYSNKFEDREDTILSSDSHEKFSEFVRETGFKPVVTLWHQPQMSENFWMSVIKNFHSDIPTLQRIVDFVYKDAAFARTEKVFYLNGFALVVAKVLPGKEAVAERLSGMKSLGMSHGFLAKNLGDNIIDRYLSFEFSVLPRKWSANMATTASLLSGDTENIMALTKEQREFLVTVLGSDQEVEKLETGTKEVETALESLLQYKDMVMDPNTTPAEEPVVEIPAEKPVQEEPEKVESPVEGITMEQIKDFMTPLKTVLDSMAEQLTALTSKAQEQDQTIQTLTKELKELRKTEDQKVAELIAPSNFWTLRNQTPSVQGEPVKVEELPAPPVAPKPENEWKLGENPIQDLFTLGMIAPQGTKK